MTLYKLLKTTSFIIFTVLFSMFPIHLLAQQSGPQAYQTQAKRVILFIWDGLRPDSITPKNTPHLFHLMQEGVQFTDNHSTYPTFTMMNASTFATGDFAGKTGFYGNTLWSPTSRGNNSAGKHVDFQQPVFTEDYKILQDLNRPHHSPLIFVNNLFSVAHKAHIKTATVGKSGPAFFQDYQQRAGMNGIVFDEKHVYPLAFAKKLQKENYPIPLLSPYAYPKGQLSLAKNNGDPTKFGKIVTLKRIINLTSKSKAFDYPDRVTPDPTATRVSPYAKSNIYLMDTYLNKILPTESPTLSVVWLRNPDTTEHYYGVGSPSYYTALTAQDQLLVKLLKKLKQLHMLKDTDLIIASDHSHSNVSGSLFEFPLRGIKNGTVTTINPNGVSVSGDFRPADLLTRAGFKAYDGLGCQYNPVLSGIKANGERVYPIHIDKTGNVCGRVNQLYTTPPYKVPASLSKGAIVVAANGGSTYLYVPSHNPTLIQKIVRFLQSREEFDAVFTDDRYGQLPGTLPLSLIRNKNPQGRNPDIIVSSTYNPHAVINGMKGTEYSSAGIGRGMHGSFSPIDVHNTLIASGPDFKSHYQDVLPTGNVDVPVTIAYLLHIPLPNTHGRPLLEALKHGLQTKDYRVLKVIFTAKQPATQLIMKLSTNPDGKDIDQSANKYTLSLHTKSLILHGKKYTYFDYAKAQRK